MKPPKCKLCGSEHWGLDHVFASNAASNTESASNNASNGGVHHSGGKKVKPAGPKVSPVSGPNLVEAFLPPKQRWDRAAYNAYQREYMRKRRLP